jgi:hypothetical protein
MFKSLARSAVLGVVAGAAGAAGVGVGAFALYVALKGPLGQAGAAAVVAILFLLIALVAAMALRGGRETGGDHGRASPAGLPMETGGLKARALEFAKQRPLVAGGVGILGALYLLRNPALLTGLIGLAAGRQEGRQEMKRGWF